MAHQRNTTRTGTVKGDWHRVTKAYYQDDNWSWRTKKPKPEYNEDGVELQPCGCPIDEPCICYTRQ